MLYNDDYLSIKIAFSLSKKCRPYINSSLCDIFFGLHCLPNQLFTSILNEKHFTVNDLVYEKKPSHLSCLLISLMQISLTQNFVDFNTLKKNLGKLYF